MHEILHLHLPYVPTTLPKYLPQLYVFLLALLSRDRAGQVLLCVHIHPEKS